MKGLISDGDSGSFPVSDLKGELGKTEVVLLKSEKRHFLKMRNVD